MKPSSGDAQGGVLRGRQGLYAIIDPALCVREPLEVAAAALAAGCAVLQLRDKAASDAQLEPLARALLVHCSRAGVPFVVNDRPELALALGSDAVHLGQRDMPIEQARALCGSLPIGISTHGVEQALDAQRRGADHVGFGPIFDTSSKPDPDPVVGLERLSDAGRALSIPIVAIGGIGADNIDRVRAAGAPLAAVLSALCAAADPAAAARTLVERAR